MEIVLGFSGMFDINSIIEGGGLLLIGLIVFAESGILIGFFLPGDTLLFWAGFFASQDKLPIAGLITIVIIAAIVGDQVGYQIGKKTGPKIFRKKDGILFRQEYLIKAQQFYEKHGGKTIILARFTPIIRTFAPVIAGAAGMSKARFTFFNVFGGAGWGLSVIMLGYWLGNRIPNIDKYLYPLLFVIVLCSFTPAVYHLFRTCLKSNKN